MLNSGRNNLWQIESHLVVLLPMAVVAWLLSRAALIVPKIWKMKLKRQCHHIQGLERHTMCALAKQALN